MKLRKKNVPEFFLIVDFITFGLRTVGKYYEKTDIRTNISWTSGDT